MSEHSGNCASGAGHQTLVLVLTVPDEHLAFAQGALAAMRSGLMSGYIGTEPDYACSFYGPFTVDGEDKALIDAMGDYREGRFEDSPKEPSVIREKALLAGVHALVKAAS